MTFTVDRWSNQISSLSDCASWLQQPRNQLFPILPLNPIGTGRFVHGPDVLHFPHRVDRSSRANGAPFMRRDIRSIDLHVDPVERLIAICNRRDPGVLFLQKKCTDFASRVAKGSLRHSPSGECKLGFIVKSRHTATHSHSILSFCWRGLNHHCAYYNPVTYARRG